MRRLSPRVLRSLAAIALCLTFAAPAFTALAVTPPSTVIQEARFTASKTTYVYITKTGKKYHKNGCRYLKKSKIKKTLKWAKSHGYTACKVCKPPK